MAKAQVDGYTPRMKKHYEEVVRPKLKEEFGFKIMWEINSRIDKSYMPIFLRHMPYCDMWSLNRAEAFALFEVDSDQKAIEKIREFGKPCYYRIGTEDSYNPETKAIEQRIVATVETTSELSGSMKTKLERLIRLHVDNIDAVTFEIVTEE